LFKKFKYNKYCNYRFRKIETIKKGVLEKMKRNTKMSFLLLIVLLCGMVLASNIGISFASNSASVTITATGNPATNYVNPNIPPVWVGESCTEDVFNIVNAVLDDNIKTIYLQNGPNGEPFIFAGAANFVWITKPKIIEGLDARVLNDGSEVPLEYSSTVPTTTITHPATVEISPTFVIGTSGVTIRNIWLDSDSGGILRILGNNLVEWLLPPNPNPYGDITIEDNVIVAKAYGISLWDIECGLNIFNNYIHVTGFYYTDETWTAIMVWSDRPEYTTKDAVNVVGNYIKYHKGWWPLEFGGLTYQSKYTNIMDNTITGSTILNLWWTAGQSHAAIYDLAECGIQYRVMGNHFIDIDAPEGCVLLLTGVKDALVMNNEFTNVQVADPEDLPPWTDKTGAIYCTRTLPEGIDTIGCKIAANDFRNSGLPGWTTGGPGCVKLNEGTYDYIVVEFLLPEGTTLEDQVLDEGVDNKVHGPP
jgi:hypothetical protein